MRIAAFGFRTIPPAKGAAGADKFALELFPRLVKLGHSVVAYNRHYPDVFVDVKDFKGVRIINLKTISRSGFDTLIHSFKATCHIIFKNTADIVHIQNGGNSIWALPLRLFGKKVFISQDGVDWKRDKWPWYGKLYLKFSAYLTAHLPNQVIFDNVIAKKLFEHKFKKQYTFIPFGSEVDTTNISETVLKKWGLEKEGYYLFIGRFIPDKGLHYLIPGFKRSGSKKKLILIGGSPNPSAYEKEILAMADSQIIFPGYVYGDDANSLIANAYCYIQPSDVEGLSPVVLTVMGLNTPMIVSDIPENIYVVEDTVTTFKKGSVGSLAEKINYCEQNYDHMKALALKARERALSVFNWDSVAEQHVKVFEEN